MRHMIKAKVMYDLIILICLALLSILPAIDVLFLTNNIIASVMAFIVWGVAYYIVYKYQNNCPEVYTTITTVMLMSLLFINYFYI